MGAIDLDPRNLAERLAGAARRLMDGSMPAEERSPVYLLASDEQRSTLDSLQALMAVVEGHGNYVMDTVGAQVIPSFARMKRLFERRREQVNAVQRAINYVIGLEMKLRQYEIGQAFCEKVAADGGPSALARLWESPESFPSMAELREPVSWLRRVA
jgi:putative hydrolase